MQRHEERYEPLTVSFCPARFRQLEEDIYDLRVIDIKRGCGKFENDQFIFWFEVIDGEYKDCRLNALFNVKKSLAISEGSKLWRWVKDLLGVEPCLGPHRLQMLIGLECKGLVAKLSNGKYGNRIEKIWREDKISNR